ncbi:hypothetical protein B0T25DRAFT_564272 [Lasiosphaeria hispida]|uniref:FAD/NAD(P)-binding domain-containing protein n=1 Tax=Lasiosphaeria hispida TaxID=260671 RepID=A0AAJ0HPV9_9PEZI|nr:hypothetical protein B0T25DRAFT_564272 [Lasiosphaeria hispida]
MVRTIVILGASYTGVPVAHYLLKHTADKIVDGLKVILVSPNTHLYWCWAGVRAILPNMMADEKVFLPITPNFAQYPTERFEFVLGKAENVNPGINAVTVHENDGTTRTIAYDELIIATGSSFKGGLPFKTLSTTEETKEVLHAWTKRIQFAKSIVVAGGGTTGIELVAELGQEYAANGDKEVTLIINSDLPFSSAVKKSVRETAVRELKRFNVKIITNTRVVAETKGGKGAPTILQLTTLGSHGKKETDSLETDLYLPVFGVVPNTSYLPPSMLDEHGFVNQTSTLRAKGHDNIFVVGDAGNIQEPRGKTADEQVMHLVKILDAYLLGADELPEYRPSESVPFGVSLGRNGGTAQVGNWRVWSWLVWFGKARYLGTDYAHDLVKGVRTVHAKNW